MRRRPLILHLRARYALDWHGLHGASHWARVRSAGLALAARSGADPEVVELFALLHDACRTSDGHDPEHGPRAARLAEELRRELFPIDDDRFALLAEALHGHTLGKITAEPTIQTCWDADRLDLGRAGIRPNPRRLGTEAARGPGVIARAWERSRRWVEFRRSRRSRRSTG